MPTRLQSVSFSSNSLSDILRAKPGAPVVIPVFQSESDEVEPAFIASAQLMELQQLTGLDLINVLRSENFIAEAASSVYLSYSAHPLLFAGLGKPDRVRPYRLHKAFSKALASIQRKEIPAMIATLQPIIDSGANAGLTADQAGLQLICAAGDFCYHSREAKEPGRTISELILHGNADLTSVTEFGLAVTRARASAMDLVNMPANIKTTTTLADEARSLEGHGIRVRIIDDVKWISEQMPCFYEVAKGSLATDPPKWITATYQPATEVRYRIALIGKSVIFDTGGYQVKPDPYMNTMKADMTGGATVLAVLREIAALKLPRIEVTAYLAATPNKIDSSAMLPDSIVNTACGKKVEIRHTDAEGRLTLIDAVTLAERENPDLIFTIATLTGSASRAVGPRIALMATDTQWRDRFAASCERYGEPSQSLDIVEEDFEDIKSKLDGADINNTGHEKYRGAQTAAAFIFSGLKKADRPLLHLDIAGGDMTPEEKATGIAVRGLMGFLRELAQD
jgi:leucyl aminopeptidase